MDRLVLGDGGVEAFHEGPEDREGLIEGRLFGAAGRRELDGGGDGGEHERGSSPMRDILGHCDRPGMYRVERAISRPAPSWLGSLTRCRSITSGDNERVGAGSYTHMSSWSSVANSASSTLHSPPSMSS